MNQPLMEQIVQHIFANLGLVAASYVDSQRTQSLIDKEFRLPDKHLNFSNDSQIVSRPIYGCQIVLGDKTFRILAGDCSQEIGSPEYCVVVQLTGLPAYGMYMICDSHIDEKESLIAVSMDNKDWMPCSTFLQATLLAAMEQLRDVGVGWSKCVNYQLQYEALLSMIKFHTNHYEEANNEG